MSVNLTRREALATLAGLGFSSVLVACGNSQSPDNQNNRQQQTEDVVVRVATLRGPSSIGLVNMMNDTSGIPGDGGDLSSVGNPEEGSGITYAYQISSAPDEVTPMVAQGTCDICFVPSNAASILYDRTEGNVELIDINTLGVLSVVTGDSSIQQWEDLAGHTVVTSGQGSTPEYVIEYLLDQAGIADRVEVTYESEHQQVATELASDPAVIAILPQPFTTVVETQNSGVHSVINLNDVWDRYAGDSRSKFVLGSTIARKDFVEQHPQAVVDFLQKHQESVQKCNDDPDGTADLVVQAGIIAKKPIAQAAIPKCNVVCITGDEMEDAQRGFLQVMSDANPDSIGGALPGEDFYYKG